MDPSTTKDEQFELVNKMLASDKPKLIVGTYRTPDDMGRAAWYDFDNREWVWQVEPQKEGEHTGLVFGVKVDDTQSSITTMFMSPELLSALWTKRRMAVR